MHHLFGRCFAWMIGASSARMMHDTPMLGTSWFNDSDPLERNGAIAIAVMLALSSTYLLIAPKFIVILLWIFIVIAIGIRIFDRATWNLEEQNLTPRTMVLRFVYTVLLAVTPALFHGATGAAVIGSGRGVIYKPDANIPVVSANFVVDHLPTSPTLWDPVFLSMDTVLLGWIFPRGAGAAHSLARDSLPLSISLCASLYGSLILSLPFHHSLHLSLILFINSHSIGTLETAVCLPRL